MDAVSDLLNERWRGAGQFHEPVEDLGGLEVGDALAVEDDAGGLDPVLPVPAPASETVMAAEPLPPPRPSVETIW